MVPRPTENLHHRQPRLGTFIFGVPVAFGVLPSAPGNAPAIRQLSIDVVGIVSCFRLRVRARWNPTTSASAGKCEDDEDGDGIPPSSSWAQTSSEGIGRFATSSWVQMSIRKFIQSSLKLRRHVIVLIWLNVST